MGANRSSVRANPFADATVGGMIDAVAARWPAREALVFGAERVTFRELRDRTIAVARGLAALGIAAGDRVALWMPNRPAWFLVQHACARLGAAVVALNIRYRAHELSYILGQSRATALVATDHLGGIDYFETLHDVLPELARAVPGEIDSAALPALRRVIVDADDPYPGCHRLQDVVDAGRDAEAAGAASEWDIETSDPARGAGAAGGVASEWGSETSDPARGPRDAGRVARAADQVFTILYTSGTTSFPKGALISHRNCVPHAWNVGDILRLGPEDRVLHALPAAGTWGGVNIPLSTWSHGACLVLMESFDALRALHLVERERCTVWNAVDQMAQAVLEHPALDDHDRSSLRTGGFAATGGGGHGLFEAVVERIGIRLAYQPYGMTEVNAMALLHDLDEPMPLRGVPGILPAPGLEVRVAHPETGAPCKVDEEGELQFRGVLVTRGYWDKPEETAKAFTDDGWFRSGDLGVRTSESHTVFQGRLREVLRISHHMVAPGEIESFLMEHHAIAQAFVVGVPDARSNEAAAAYVILKDGASLTEEALIAFCRGRIATYKIPRLVRFVRDVPRTPGPHGDKVQRGKLREQALQELREPRAILGRREGGSP